MSQPRRLGPAGLGFRLSRGCSFCRDLGDGGACGGFVGDGLARGERGEEGCDGEVVDGSRVAAGCLVDQRGGVVGEQGVGPAGFSELRQIGRVVGLRVQVRLTVVLVLVVVRPAMSRKAGMPRLTADWRRAMSPSTWASLASAAARLTLSPSASPSQPCCPASAMRAVRFSLMAASLGRCDGSMRSRGQRTQL